MTAKTPMSSSAVTAYRVSYLVNAKPLSGWPLVKQQPIIFGNKLEKAIYYIQANLAYKITLNEVAEYVDLSPFYFSRLFKKYQGIGFNDYVVMQRMLEAKRLLRGSRLSTADIASQLGFSQASYFCRVFRQSYQLTPQAYRSKMAMRA